MICAICAIAALLALRGGIRERARRRCVAADAAVSRARRRTRAYPPARAAQPSPLAARARSARRGRVAPHRVNLAVLLP